MTKTLADMTAKERQACIGMWCDVVGFTRPTPIVDMWNEEVELLTSNNLRGNIVATYGFKEVTPRFDLPRAWNPDGTPPKGEWEEGWCYTGGTPTGDYACLIETQDGTAYTSEETPTGDIRRFIHEWENTND